MSRSSSNSNTGGNLLLVGMFLVFLTLKLTGHIDWSWWWVTAPLWIPFALAIIFILIVGTIVGIGERRDRRHFDRHLRRK